MIIQTGRGPVAVRRFGAKDSRETIVALHPLAMSGEIWRPFGEWLGTRGYGVLAPDLPATMPADGALTVESMSEDIAALLDTLGLQRMPVVGMSMGGCVAQVLALSRPDLVGALVLADTTSSYGPTRAGQWAERAAAAANPVRAELLDFQLTRWFSEEFRASDPVACDRVARIFVAAASQAHVSCCRALGAFELAERVSGIKAPTLVLVGEQDYATPVAMAQALATALPHATLTVLPGVRHLSLVESTAAQRLAAEHLLGG